MLIAPGFVAGEHDFLGGLLVQRGPQQVGQQFLLGGLGPIEIGKLPENAIVLAGEGVSRCHCRLVRVHNGWRIEDAKSTNGLFVNGQRVGSAHLSDGDLIGIGEYAVRFLSLTTAAPELADFGAVAAPASPPAPAARPAKAASPAAPAAREIASAPPVPPDAEPPAGNDLLLSDLLGKLTDGEAVASDPHSATGTTVAAMGGTGLALSDDEPVCPACGSAVHRYAKVCIACGHQLTAEDRVHHVVQPAAGRLGPGLLAAWATYLIPWGVYAIPPAGAAHRAFVAGAAAVVMLFAGIWFWSHDWRGSPDMITLKNHMLWAGQGKPDAKRLDVYYRQKRYGDSESFEAKMEQLQSGDAMPAEGESLTDLAVAAHNALPPEEQCFGRYQPSQLFTYVFLHADPIHLALTVVFLLLIGSRVNAMVGNIATLVIWAVLSVVSGAVHMTMARDAAPHPTVGGSGVVMGMVGIYVMLLAAERVRMVAWSRVGLLPGFTLRLKHFTVMGFWLVVACLLLHGAYAGVKLDATIGLWGMPAGLAAGLCIGLLLLATRAVHTHGIDLISTVRGSKPGDSATARKAPLDALW